MASWTDLAAARAELRRFLDDGPQDRPVKMKQLIGSVDGVNTIFYAWDDRIIATTFVPSFDGVDQNTNLIDGTKTDYILGLIVFLAPPPAMVALRARYYFQYFTDVDLDDSLAAAAGEINETEDIITIQPGLKNAALHFAGHHAFQKQAIRWASRKSSGFLLQEEPIDGETDKRSNLFLELAKNYQKTGTEMRNSYYKRHGRRDAPAMGVYYPRVARQRPNR